MEYREALAYLDGARWNGAEPSLRRIRELLAALGDPQSTAFPSACRSTASRSPTRC